MDRNDNLFSFLVPTFILLDCLIQKSEQQARQEVYFDVETHNRQALLLLFNNCNYTDDLKSSLFIFTLSCIYT